MGTSYARYIEAAERAVEYVVSQQRADGGYAGPDYPVDCYHKIPYSLGISGRLEEAHRLLDWIKEHDLQPDGGLRHYQMPGSQQYCDTWICIGAHRLGRFDITYPLSRFIMTFQAPCGGFPAAGREDPWTRSLTTAWAGQTALYTGHLEHARRAAECLYKMIDDQPREDRFYYHTTRDGQLVTELVSPKAGFIDATKKEQVYWEASIAMIFLLKFYEATGDEESLDYAKRLWSFKLRCQDDSSTHGNSGKDGYVSSLYYALTGDIRGKEEALKFCEFLLETQLENGAWCWAPTNDPIRIYLNWAAEYSVWIYEISGSLAAGDRTWGKAATATA